MSAIMQDAAGGSADRAGHRAGRRRRGGFFLRLLRERKAAAVGLGLILFFVVLAIVAPLHLPVQPDRAELRHRPVGRIRADLRRITGWAATTAASTCSAS